MLSNRNKWERVGREYMEAERGEEWLKSQAKKAQDRGHPKRDRVECQIIEAPGRKRESLKSITVLWG